jgi:choline dehydrogenase-like flavoprotein
MAIRTGWLAEGTAADVCIVGSGPAGLSLALRLAAAGLRVDVLESGAEAPTANANALNEAVDTGIPYVVAEHRRRMFGGSSNCWGGWCCPLSDQDFASRPWVADSPGWPIAPDEISAYYPEAKKFLNLGEARFDVAYWAARLGNPVSPIFDSAAPVEPIVWLISRPAPLPARFRDELARSALIRCYLETTVLRVARAMDQQTVTGLEIANPDGTRATVRARAYVLALGGIENARLLLLSDDVERAGLLNEHNLVGSYFTEHVGSVNFGTIFGLKSAKLGLPLSSEYLIYPPDRFMSDGKENPPQGGLGFGMRLTADFQRRERLPQYWMAMLGADDTDKRLPTAARLLGADAKDVQAVSVAAAFESEPNPNSRVTLSDQTDALGQRKANLTWLITDRDRAQASRCFSAVGKWLGGQSNLVFRQGDDPGESTWVPVGGAHHIGTTRMSVDPRQGVVDPDLRAHGFNNLFICGSSTFPTPGFGNPTFSIVCLSLRLGNHLAATIGRI